MQLLSVRDHSRAECPRLVWLYQSSSNIYDRWVERMPLNHPSIRVVLSSISDPRNLVANELAWRLDLVQRTAIRERQYSVERIVMAQ